MLRARAVLRFFAGLVPLCRPDSETSLSDRSALIRCVFSLSFASHNADFIARFISRAPPVWLGEVRVLAA